MRRVVKIADDHTADLNGNEESKSLHWPTSSPWSSWKFVAETRRLEKVTLHLQAFVKGERVHLVLAMFCPTMSTIIFR